MATTDPIPTMSAPAPTALSTTTPSPAQPTDTPTPAHTPTVEATATIISTPSPSPTHTPAPLPVSEEMTFELLAQEGGVVHSVAAPVTLSLVDGRLIVASETIGVLLYDFERLAAGESGLTTPQLAPYCLGR